MRNQILVSLVVVLTACKGEPAAPRNSEVARASSSSATPPAAMKPPAPVLAEPASEKLGTAPNGFGLAVGDKAPDATLPDVTGEGRSLAALYAERPTILFFYRGGWCPFCNLQIHEYAAAKSKFDARGVGIVAISVDKPSEEAKTQAKHGAAFPMLSDAKLAAHRAYHVVHETTSNEREALAKYGVDLGAYSGESHGNYAVPATFVIDRTGTVRFVHVDQDYKTRPSARQMLEIADKVLGAPSDRRGAENAR